MSEQTPRANLADRLNEARKRAESLGEYASRWDYRTEMESAGGPPNVVHAGGVVTRTTTRTEDKEYKSDTLKPPYRILELEDDGGERVAVYCDKHRLRLLDEAEKPEVGDRVLIAYYGDDNDRGECEFAMVVERGRPVAEDAPAGDDATEAALQAERDELDLFPEGLGR